jgi:hypothetical protein
MESDAMTSFVAIQVKVAKLRVAARPCVRIAAECGNAKLLRCEATQSKRCASAPVPALMVRDGV